MIINIEQAIFSKGGGVQRIIVVKQNFSFKNV